MGLPCPQCGSTNTLSAIRRKLRRVKQRIEAEKRRVEEERRKAAAAAAAAAASHTHTLHTLNGGGGVTIGTSTLGVIGRSSGITTLSFGQIDGGRIDNNDDLGLMTINGVHLETCADCGAFYAPNVKELAEEILSEIYELDLLGAMAEIYDEETVEGKTEHGVRQV